MADDPLDKFGKLITQQLFDRGLNSFHGILEDHTKSPSTQELRNAFKELDNNQKDLIEKLVRYVLTGATHDFLFAIQQSNDLEQDITVLVDGVNVAEESDGLHGEIFLDDGWFAKFSKYY